jgi:hypothetical protein
MIAEVAELVDALGSGSSRQTPVGVRVPSSAPGREKRARKKHLPAFVSFTVGIVIESFIILLPGYSAVRPLKPFRPDFWGGCPRIQHIWVP